MKNLRHDTINNICIGCGIETDALAWLTAAEIEIDQATKQKLNIYGGGSSSFKTKLHEMSNQANDA